MPTITILVEDSKTIRDALMPSMAELGNMEVIAFAETSAEAITLLNEKSKVWQLAVVDLFLKEGTGMNVLRACRDRRHDERVVMLSNYVNPVMKQRCLDLGANAVFDKSTEIDAFFEYCHSLSCS